MASCYFPLHAPDAPRPLALFPHHHAYYWENLPCHHSAFDRQKRKGSAAWVPDVCGARCLVEFIARLILNLVAMSNAGEGDVSARLMAPNVYTNQTVVVECDASPPAELTVITWQLNIP